MPLPSLHDQLLRLRRYDGEAFWPKPIAQVIRLALPLQAVDRWSFFASWSLLFPSISSECETHCHVAGWQSGREKSASFFVYTNPCRRHSICYFCYHSLFWILACDLALLLVISARNFILPNDMKLVALIPWDFCVIADVINAAPSSNISEVAARRQIKKWQNEYNRYINDTIGTRTSGCTPESIVYREEW